MFAKRLTPILNVSNIQQSFQVPHGGYSVPSRLKRSSALVKLQLYTPESTALTLGSSRMIDEEQMKMA